MKRTPALVHALAVTTAIATYLLILIGGLVHGTGSSLACPDWPTCYGTMMPKMEGGVLVEHSHRLAAGSVVLLTIALALSLTFSKAPHQKALRPYGWLAVGLVIVQAVLGGVTVLLRLPTPVSTAHTAVSLLFFMTTLYLAFRSGSPRVANVRPPALATGAVRLALASAVAVYFQMVLGGLVRHSGAALACLDLPLCRGSIWPDAHPTVLIHVLHRLNALVVTALVLTSSVVTVRAASKRPLLRGLALLAPLLVLTQVWLGVHAVQSFLDLATVESHLAVATALLATQIAIVLLGRPDAAPAPIRLRWFADLVSLTKPRITGLVLATFAGGMWLAPGALPTWRIVMTLIGMALVVSASNTLNMYLERDADGLMARTRARPLPERRLSPESALAFGVLLASAALPLLFLAGNALTGILGAVALLSYVWIYTPMKRHSALALFVGAVPGAMPPLMGWTAATGHLDAPGLVLFAILFLWQIPHFLAIAIYRSQDYQQAGFKVLPLAISAFGTRLHIMTFSVGLVVATILLLPMHVAGVGYAVAASVLGAVFIGWAVAGFRQAAAARWARSLFFMSIVYLTLLFVALIVDRTVV
ncbi:MAG TPA: heme o synthase [Polyangia bacterium]|jgi:protoheme IX farnesyltransferase|nr:heme o synthase [Polyangia bacterium]